jgi:hypothetical protein
MEKSLARNRFSDYFPLSYGLTTPPIIEPHQKANKLTKPVKTTKLLQNLVKISQPQKSPRLTHVYSY